MTLLRIATIVVAITAGACYPYLPGEYDPLAVPLSHVAQVGSAAGLLLVPLGLVGLMRSRRPHAHPGSGPSRAFRRAAAAGLAILALVVSAVAWGSGGRLFGLVVLAISVAMLVAHRRSAATPAAFTMRAGLPIALVVVPVAAVLLQLLLAGPLRAFARDRAMTHAAVLVEALAGHRASHGRYPQSLTAAWPDYKAAVVGVDRFHYLPHDESYTLYFELPVPLWQAPGTREFVAYDPSGRHVVLSHAAWHITRSPASLGENQGWYAAHATARAGWRSFLFD